ncbi:MAG TPA: monovalent cation:proton antiporter-2 (CPA2) family protein, partial [Patescibacteria group bacterium]|nr:monovalent cation:proton antiporter-2 (CPA2) family protein [Patescibacteria group bacterium]
EQALILLLAAVVAVPIFTRFRLGAVLAYLCAGALIGPHALGFVDSGEQQLAVAELGVVLLMFVVGMELSPARLWLMRRMVFGLGALQFFATALLFALLALAFGQSWQVAVIIGGALALSSTAIGVQLMAERKTLNLQRGRMALAILLFQDLAAIPALTLIPLLAMDSDGASAWSLVGVAKALGSVVAVVLLGRYAVRPLFRIAAKSGSVESFTATTLVVALGTAWITGFAGLSMALGAFLGGIVLADSEYRHEIESHLEPFKGLLLGLFFLSVGMGVDWALVGSMLGQVLLGVAVLIMLKAAVLYLVGRHAGALSAADAIRMAAVISQGGEFAFVLLALGFSVGVLPGDVRDLLSASIVLSMATTPLLVMAADRLASRWVPKATRAYDELPQSDAPHVVIAGFGRVGQIVGRVLRASRIPFTALEPSVDQVDLSRRFGNLIYYGDPGRADTLRAARVDQAKVFVLAMDDPLENVRVAKLVRHQYPNVRIVARARNRQHVFALWEADVQDVVRETFHSSLGMARRTLDALGIDAARAEARVDRFRQHDEAMLRAQFKIRDDESKLIQTSQEALAELQQIFEADELEPKAETARDEASERG